MIEIKIIHEWRPGHADPLARIERIILVMADIVQRLTDSVSTLAVAISNQGAALGDVATAIRNHPSSTTDNGRLSALADQIDGIAANVVSSTEQLQSLRVEEDTEDAGGAAVAGAEVGSEEAAPPVVGADDGSAGAGGDAGSSSGSDASGGGDAGVPSGSEPTDPPADAPLGDGSASADTSAGGADATTGDQGASASDAAGSSQSDTASGDGFQ